MMADKWYAIPKSTVTQKKATVFIWRKHSNNKFYYNVNLITLEMHTFHVQYRLASDDPNFD